MTSDTLLGTTLAGYRIEALLARGGMGVVYRAFDPELSRQVALKVIAPELAGDSAFKERFLRELEVAASLEHPHICPVYRAGEAEGELFLVMRLLEGEDLGQRLVRDGPLEPSLAAELVSQLASALDYAHARSLWHRDVKPENVLLDGSGNPYLVDFGLAAETFEQGEEGTLAGTLSYLAPERLQGAATEPASDQYALACLATALLTGDPPFLREHEAALLYAHLREEPPSLEAHGLARADPVFRRALAKDPSERYPSCSAFASELAAAISRPERVGGEAWPEGLPRPATRLVGRKKELSEISTLLRQAGARLVTLTGPGGTGKTRLALQAAAESAEAFPGGVSWVSLAPLRDPAYALSTIAQALEIQEQPPAPLQDTLREALKGRNCLLVLDNAEHLLPSLADDISALREAPGPAFLVTSRERLDLQAERLYPVPSLQETEAVELFNDRASYLDPAHDPEDPAIPLLCERLDSLPLALELAAARSDLYSPHELLEALAGHLELLKGARDHDPRHQTLQATIAWSYELLAEEEQRAFRALSVFAGGCTAEAAEEVAGAELKLLHSLLAKSLLRTRESSAGRRYWILETIREYAGERLAEHGEEEAARERHAGYFCRLAIEAEEGLGGAALSETLDALRAEHENLRSALLRDRTGNPARAVGVISSLRRYWFHAGGAAEADRLLRELLEGDLDLSDAGRADALLGAGSLSYILGDFRQARQSLEASIELLRPLDDPARLATALNNHGLAAVELGDLDAAEVSYTERAEITRSLGDLLAYAMTLANLAVLAFRKRDLRRARAFNQQALELQRDAGSPVDVALSLANLSEYALAAGAVFEARAYALEGFDLLAEHESRMTALHLRVHLSRCDLAEGSYPAAREHLRAALEDYIALMTEPKLVQLLDAVAEYCAPVDGGASARLIGRGDGLCASLDIPRNWSQAERRERLLRDIAAEIGAEGVRSSVEAGFRLSIEETLDLVRRVLAAPAPESA